MAMPNMFMARMPGIEYAIDWKVLQLSCDKHKQATQRIKIKD
jgi:hypothetical protein